MKTREDERMAEYSSAQVNHLLALGWPQVFGVSDEKLTTFFLGYPFDAEGLVILDTENGRLLVASVVAWLGGSTMLVTVENGRVLAINMDRMSHDLTIYDGKWTLPKFNRQRNSGAIGKFKYTMGTHGGDGLAARIEALGGELFTEEELGVLGWTRLRGDEEFVGVVFDGYFTYGVDVALKFDPKTGVVGMGDVLGRTGGKGVVMKGLASVGLPGGHRVWHVWTMQKRAWCVEVEEEKGPEESWAGYFVRLGGLVKGRLEELARVEDERMVRGLKNCMTTNIA